MKLAICVLACCLAATAANENFKEEPWAEQLGEEGEGAHEAMTAWLTAFFENTAPEDLHPAAPVLPTIKPRGFVLPQRRISVYPESLSDAHYWTKWDVNQTCDAFLASVAPLSVPRRHLIIAPVGSKFNASRWLTHPQHASYDIIALYYGNHSSFTCPLCLATLQLPGTKWYLLNTFLKQNATFWSELVERYDAVMVADDDIAMDTCVINRAFELFDAYGLLLGQPSLCRTAWRSTFWQYLHQSSSVYHSVLRYITFVEIMAPIFRMDFFQGVVAPTLYNAYTGWGLDFTWPWLLRYPRRHIGVIDEVCMTHTAPSGQKRGEGSVYAVPVPYGEREEEGRRVAEYHYYPSRVEAVGLPYRNMETLALVRQRFTAADQVPPGAGAEVPPPNGLPERIVAGNVNRQSQRGSLMDSVSMAPNAFAGVSAAGYGLDFRTVVGYLLLVCGALIAASATLTKTQQDRKRQAAANRRVSRPPKHPGPGVIPVV